jgi:hypothetical protein
MKALVLFSALMAVSTASVDRLAAPASSLSASAVQVQLHKAALVSDQAMLPKCFPYCPN